MSLPAAALLAESDSGKGSPIGLFVVLLLVIAVYLLYRSMAGHLRRLPEKFPHAGDAGDSTAGAGPAAEVPAASPPPVPSDGPEPPGPQRPA